MSPAEHPADSDAATVDLDRRGVVAVLRVGGEIDLLADAALQKAVARALADEPSVFVVDLTEVTFLGSTGLSALVAAQQAAGERTAVRVVATTRVTLRPIALAALDTVLDIRPSLEDALDPAP
ncbi:STAS domain-containing protein [Actinophytocola sp.]|uniref:STAS domain-containing protein n=1 Tax=Actinophytocola sp. TaxID=1872138 RepID=UPI003D6C3B85